ncbi:hypothetical protein ACFXGR_46385 [Streptomyces mirabilis]|uniref:hypothetical protein n=1 Tax=Streptomyces mirabilis TaxID=68239 RepID=UPI003682DE8D
MSAREFWKTVRRLTASGIDGDVRDQEAERLQRPKIVVLCGSTRYWQELAEANLYETAAGRIVLAPGCNLKQPHPLWAAPAQSDRLKQVLDALHRQKIDLADEVLIVNVNVRPSSPARGARGHLPSGPALCIDGSLSPLRVKSEGTSEFVSLLLAA